MIEQNFLNIFILECVPQVVVINDIEILVEADIGFKSHRESQNSTYIMFHMCEVFVVVFTAAIPSLGNEQRIDITCV